MLSKFIVALIIFLIPLNCFAFTIKPDGFKVYVTLAQKVTCRKWHQERKLSQPNAYEWFVVGYLSAFNAYVPGIKNITEGEDIKSIYLWIDNYCQKHPFKSLALAIHEFGREIHPYEKRKKSGFEDVESLVD